MPRPFQLGPRCRSILSTWRELFELQPQPQSRRAGSSGAAALSPLPWLRSGCLVLGGRTGLASIPVSCVFSSRVASPSGASAAAGAVPAASSGSPIARPACSAGSPACLFLRRWLVPGGVTCVPWALESSHCSLPPSPLPPLLEQACAGLCLMPGELCCSFLKAAQPLLGWPDFHTLAVTGRLFRAG